MISNRQTGRQTLDDRLKEAEGRPSGFDYLRIYLAICVIFFHSFDLTAGYNVSFHRAHGIFRPFDAIVLPMFFALSGFLVAGSLERSKTLISFLGLRAIRLMPALLVETVLSAIIIGLFFSKFPWHAYFINPMFFKYFLNIFGDIHFTLPGVFGENTFRNTVNGQLWTIPWELKCYGAIAAFWLLRFTKNKYVFLCFVAALNVGLFTHHCFLGPNRFQHSVGDGSVDGPILVLCFLFGICLFFFRANIPWNKWIFITALPLVIVLLSLPIAFYGDFLIPLPAAYATVFIGLLQPHRSKLVSSGDYSYGIYLYGFPIQQSVIAIFLQNGIAISWYSNFIISLALASLLAIGSWHLIEKRASKLRPQLMQLEATFLKLFVARRVQPSTSISQ